MVMVDDKGRKLTPDQIKEREKANKKEEKKADK